MDSRLTKAWTEKSHTHTSKAPSKLRPAFCAEGIFLSGGMACFLHVFAIEHVFAKNPRQAWHRQLHSLDSFFLLLHKEPDKKMIFVYHKGEKNCVGSLRTAGGE